MKDRSALLNFIFVFLIISMAVVISVRSKWASLEAVVDRNSDIYVVKHTGYYDKREITGAESETDIPIDRISHNSYHTSMAGDMRGVSTTSSTMTMP